jgi:hypothetical protein
LVGSARHLDEGVALAIDHRVKSPQATTRSESVGATGFPDVSWNRSVTPCVPDCS